MKNYLRDKNILSTKELVLEAVNFKIKNKMADIKRRAVVFYLDKGSGFLGLYIYYYFKSSQ